MSETLPPVEVKLTADTDAFDKAVTAAVGAMGRLSKTGADVHGALKRVASGADAAASSINHVGDAARKLEAVNVQMGKMQKATQDIGAGLRQVAADAMRGADAVNYFGDELRKLQALSSAFDRLAKPAQDVKGALKGLQQGTAEAATGMGYFNEHMDRTREKAKAAVAPIAAFAGAAAVALVGLGGKAIKLASDFNETKSAAEQVFGKAGAAKMMEWAEASGSAMGRSTKQMVEFATEMQQLLSPLTGSSEKAAVLSTNLAQLAVDIASMNNASDVEVLQSLKSAMSGQIEPMQKYGVVLTENATKEFMRANAIRGTLEKMSEAEKAAIRYRMILAKTTESQGDSVRTADSFSNQLKRLTGTFEDIGVRIGMALLPAAGKVLKAINDVLALFRSISPTAIQVAAVLGGVAASIAAIVAVTAGLMAAAPVFTALSAAASLLAGSFTAAIGPVLIIAAGVAGLIALVGALRLAWRENLFGVRDTATKAWGAIHDTAIAAWKGVTEIIGKALGFLADSWRESVNKWVLGAKTMVTYAVLIGEHLQKMGILSQDIKLREIGGKAFASIDKVGAALQPEEMGKKFASTAAKIWDGTKTFAAGAKEALVDGGKNVAESVLTSLKSGGEFIGGMIEDVMKRFGFTPTTASKPAEAPKAPAYQPLPPTMQGKTLNSAEIFEQALHKFERKQISAKEFAAAINAREKAWMADPDAAENKEDFREQSKKYWEAANERAEQEWKKRMHRPGEFRQVLESDVTKAERLKREGGPLTDTQLRAAKGLARETREADQRKAWKEMFKDLGTSMLGKVGPLSAAMQGAQAGAAAGPMGAVAGAGLGLLTSSKQFGEVMESVNTIFQSVADIVGKLLDGLKPLLTIIGEWVAIVGNALNPIFHAVGSVFKALIPAFKAIGDVLHALAPLITFSLVPLEIVSRGLEALAPVFAGLGAVITTVAYALAKAWDTIVEAVQEIVNFIADIAGLLSDDAAEEIREFSRSMDGAKAGSDRLGKQMKTQWETVMSGNVARMFEVNAINKVAGAANNAAEQLTNVPEGFKVAAARFAAIANDAASVTGGSSAKGGPATDPGKVADSILGDGATEKAKQDARDKGFGFLVDAAESGKNGGGSASGGVPGGEDDVIDEDIERMIGHDLPALAEGGFVRGPTAAIIGDTVGEGEIVAPESKMFEIVRQAISASGGGAGVELNFYGITDINVIVAKVVEALRRLGFVRTGSPIMPGPPFSGG